NASWYCHPIAFGQIFCRLAATAGGLIVTREPNGLLRATYQGFDVRMSAALPDGSSSLVGAPMLLFGDLAMAAMLCEARSLTLAVSREARPDTDQIWLRGTQRMDIVCHSCGSADASGPMSVLFGK